MGGRKDGPGHRACPRSGSLEADGRGETLRSPLGELTAQRLQGAFWFCRQGGQGQVGGWGEGRGDPASWPQGLTYLSALSSQKPVPSPSPTTPAILPQARPQPRLLPSSLNIFLSPTSFPGARLRCACLQLASFLRGFSRPSSVCACAGACVCPGRLSSSRRSRPRPPPLCVRPAPGAPSPSTPTGLAALVSPCISLFSPLSLCPSSDLDRDFWNNNESTVQQKWSSYPPKEFILNISPYAPYGDPRLSLK